MIFKRQNCVLGMHSTQKPDWATCTTKDKWKKPENFTLLAIPQLNPAISTVCSFIYPFTAQITVTLWIIYNNTNPLAVLYPKE